MPDDLFDEGYDRRQSGGWRVRDPGTGEKRHLTELRLRNAEGRKN